MTSSAKDDDASRRAILVAKLTENRFQQIDSRCALQVRGENKNDSASIHEILLGAFHLRRKWEPVEINSPLFRAISTPFSFVHLSFISFAHHPGFLFSLFTFCISILGCSVYFGSSPANWEAQIKEGIYFKVSKSATEKSYTGGSCIIWWGLKRVYMTWKIYD